MLRRRSVCMAAHRCSQKCDVKRESRPESMARAVVKASADMRPGSWLVSLEFEARQLLAEAVLTVPDGRPLWLYRVPFVMRKAADAATQDK